MRHIVRYLAIVLAGGVLTAGGDAPAPAGVEWFGDYELAMEKALLTRRPVLVTFYADWCGWCRKLERNAFVAPDFVDLSRGFVPVRINGDRERGLAALLRVKGYPTTVILDRRGRERGRISGYRPTSVYVAEVRAALADHGRLEELRARAGGAPEDAEAQYALGDELLAVGLPDEAHECFARVRAMDPGDRLGLAADAELDLALSRLFAYRPLEAMPLFEAFFARWGGSDRRDEALFFHGIALVAAGRRDEGLERIREAAAETSLRYIKFEAERLAGTAGEMQKSG